MKNRYIIQLIALFAAVLIGETAWGQTSNSPTQTICVGTLQPYCVDCGNPTPGSTYQWTIINGTGLFSGNISANGTNDVDIDWGTSPAGTYTLQVLETNSSCQGTLTTLAITLVEITDLTANPTNPTCGLSNGQISVVSVVGGVAPYTYSIDDVTYGTSSLFTGLAAGSYTVYVHDANQCEYSEVIVLTDQPGPTAIASTTVNPTCGQSNGSITITGATGGTGPYTYSLDDVTYTSTLVYSNLAANTYNVYVHDVNGCEYTTTVTLTDQAGPTAIASTTINPTCGQSNGSITITGATGGTGPYTYSLDDVTYTSTLVYSNLAANTYNVYVHDVNGCEYTTTVTLTDQAGPTAIASTTVNPTCGQSNGSITITGATGGTGPYTYSLDDVTYTSTLVYSNLAANTYNVYVHDVNGCEYTTTVTLTDQAGPTAIASTTVNPTCGQSNGSITITGATGGTGPYTYSLDDVTYTSTLVYSNLAANTYSVYVHDVNGCEYTTTVTLTDIAGPTVSVSPVQPICEGDAVDLVATGALTYSWTPNTALSATTGSTVSASPTVTTIYTVTGTDANGCTDTADVTVSVNPTPTTTPIFHN